MIQIRSSKANPETILSLITQEDIFEKYLGFSVRYNKSFRNPLRGDDNVTCRFTDKFKYIIFRDFVEERSWNCFELVKRYYNCDYNTALQKIVEDFKLDNSVTNIKPNYISHPFSFDLKPKTAKSEIRIKRIPFSKVHLNYWKQYYLDIDDLEDVFAIKCYWFNGFKRICNTPSFAYHWYDYEYKLYFPFVNKKEGIRFLHTDSSIIQGEKQLNFDKNILIITSSYKDVLVMRKLAKLFDLDYEVVSPQSETTLISQDKIDFYKSKYSYLLLYHNNDEAGIKAAERQSKEYNIDFIINPENSPKDNSDYCKVFGLKATAELLDNLIYKILPPF